MQNYPACKEVKLQIKDALPKDAESTVALVLLGTKQKGEELGLGTLV